MGFKQWPSVLFCFAKITPVIYQLKVLNGVNVHFLMVLFYIALGNFSHFEYFIKLKEHLCK